MIEIHEVKITVGQLARRYHDDDDEGVWALSDKLEVRPKYQRAECYSVDNKTAVISTLIMQVPIGNLSWSQETDEYDNAYYECVDGQQRTLSICEYITNQLIPVFSSEEIVDYPLLRDYNKMPFKALDKEHQDRILQYVITVNVIKCDDPKFKYNWFRRININGVPVNNQELRNCAYCGTFVSAARTYFSKTNCAASLNDFDKVINGNYTRQKALETALEWAVTNSTDENIKTIEDYMHIHQNDESANDLIRLYEKICRWAIRLFGIKHLSLTRNQDWGRLYKMYHNADNNDAVYIGRNFEEEMDTLLQCVDGRDEMGEHVGNKRGIVEYILSGDTKYLEVRSFSKAFKEFKYYQQGGLCPDCGKHFEIDEMEGDHDTAVANGGRTVLTNLVMRCKKCNRKKGSK